MPSTRSTTTVLASAFDVTFVVDRSGSMQCVGDAMREGTTEFLEKHANAARENPDMTYHLRIVSFDDRADVLYDGPAAMLLAEDGALDPAHTAPIYAGLAPRGRTRLVATLTEEVMAQQARVTAWHKSLPAAVRRIKPGMGVVFAALTDGINNLPGDIDALLHRITTHRTDHTASCQFIAANQDAVATGAQFGFPAGLCLQMDADPAHARAAMTCVTNSAMRSFTGEIADFREVERTMSSQDAGHQPHILLPFCQPTRM